MGTVKNILFKVIIKDFYKRNTWWLLLLFMALFGLIKDPIRLHKELMFYIQHTPMALLVYIVLFLFYILNVIFFLHGIFQKKEHYFLWNFSLLSYSQKSLMTFAIVITLLLPICVYSFFVVIIGLNHGLYWSAGILSIVGIFFITICSYCFLFNAKGKFIFPILNRPIISVSSSFWTYLLHYICSVQRKKYIWIKIVSLLILSIPLVRNKDAFQLSDFNIFWTTALATNLILLYDLFLFFNTQLRFLRQLPIPIYRFLMQSILTCSFLMALEIILVWIYHTSLRNLSWTTFSVYSIGITLLLLNVQWDKQNGFSNYMGIGALILIGLLFLAPYKLFFPLGLAGILGSTILFVTHYYSYETQIKEENPNYYKKEK